MRLLFDQNISFRVVKRLLILYPEAKHIADLGLINATDRQIWNYAKENQYTITTFDADFYDLVTLFGHPPKVIWLRLGNSSTENLATLFERKYNIVKDFLTEAGYIDIGCLEIDE